MRFHATTTFVKLVILSIFICSVAAAQAPNTVLYQGRLTDNLGDPITNTTRQIVFAIYSVPTGGSRLWNETQTVSLDENGVFTTELGSVTAMPSNLFGGSKRYLGITVVTEGTEMSPRQVITSTPYSINTDYDSDLLDLADGSLTGSKVGSGISANNITTGTVSDARLESTVNRTSFIASDFVAASGGVHVGGTSDPGTDNLVVDGNIGVGVAPSAQLHMAANTTIPVRLHRSSGCFVGFLGGTTSWSAGRWGGAFRLFITDSVGAGIQDQFEFTTAYFAPWSDGSKSLGTSSKRWSVVWAQSGVIQTSDRRLKRDITDLHYGLNDISQLRPVTYRWKSSPDSRRKIGLVAQEVQEVIPEVVEVGNDDDVTLGVNYADLVPLVIKAIQEQQDMLDKQAFRIEQLEKALIAQKPIAAPTSTSSNFELLDAETLKIQVSELTETVRELQRVLAAGSANAASSLASASVHGR
jgi:hypothetical protein